MLLVLAVKTYVLGGCMTPIAFGVLGTGILFGCYNLAVARNPEENENLLGTFHEDINGNRIQLPT